LLEQLAGAATPLRSGRGELAFRVVEESMLGRDDAVDQMRSRMDAAQFWDLRLRYNTEERLRL